MPVATDIYYDQNLLRLKTYSDCNIMHVDSDQSVGTNLIHDFTATTCYVKSGFIHEKYILL